MFGTALFFGVCVLYRPVFERVPKDVCFEAWDCLLCFLAVPFFPTLFQSLTSFASLSVTHMRSLLFVVSLFSHVSPYFSSMLQLFSPFCLTS